MGGGHGHGHGPPYTVPDYKVYKVETCPELVDLQARLAEKGLKDPWLRNEVWRFDRANFPTVANNIKMGLSRGLATGIVLAGITILLGSLTKKSGGHEEHKDEHH